MAVARAEPTGCPWELLHGHTWPCWQGDRAGAMCCQPCPSLHEQGLQFHKGAQPGTIFNLANSLGGNSFQPLLHWPGHSANPQSRAETPLSNEKALELTYTPDSLTAARGGSRARGLPKRCSPSPPAPHSPLQAPRASWPCWQPLCCRVVPATAGISAWRRCGLWAVPTRLR